MELTKEHSSTAAQPEIEEISAQTEKPDPSTEPPQEINPIDTNITQEAISVDIPKLEDKLEKQNKSFV